MLDFEDQLNLQGIVQLQYTRFIKTMFIQKLPVCLIQFFELPPLQIHENHYINLLYYISL